MNIFIYKIVCDVQIFYNDVDSRYSFQLLIVAITMRKFN